MRATRASPQDLWTQPVAVTELGDGGETGLWVAPDGLTIYFASNRAPGGDLWMATRASRSVAWSAPVTVSELNSSSIEQRPSLYEGDTRIVFFTGRLGGPGAYDLWQASRPTAADPWNAPQPLPAINTASNDQDPCISADGLELYFVSDRAGNDDIYVATRASLQDEFGPPVKLANVNTAFRDIDPWISPDGRLLMFASDRDGDVDIYMATR